MENNKPIQSKTAQMLDEHGNQFTQNKYSTFQADLKQELASNKDIISSKYELEAANEVVKRLSK